MPTIERRELRVLVLAPRERDAGVIASVMAKEGLDSEPVDGADALVAQIKRGAAAAVVCEESLSSEALGLVAEWLRSQASWSDFPFVILLSKRASPRSAGVQATWSCLNAR
jgi:hypothetical protein